MPTIRVNSKHMHSPILKKVSPQAKCFYSVLIIAKAEGIRGKEDILRLFDFDTSSGRRFAKKSAKELIDVGIISDEYEVYEVKATSDSTAAERKRRSREKKKRECHALFNLNVTRDFVRDVTREKEVPPTETKEKAPPAPPYRENKEQSPEGKDLCVSSCASACADASAHAGESTRLKGWTQEDEDDFNTLRRAYPAGKSGTRGVMNSMTTRMQLRSARMDGDFPPMDRLLLLIERLKNTDEWAKGCIPKFAKFLADKMYTIDPATILSEESTKVPSVQFNAPQASMYVDTEAAIVANYRRTHAKFHGGAAK